MDPNTDFGIATVIWLSTGTAVLLVTLFAFVMMRYQRRAIKQQLALQEQETAFQKELLAANIRTQERERKRIARDMHDEVGALLSTVKLHLGMLSMLTKLDEKGKAWSGEHSQMLDDSIQKVRRISHALLPPTLEDYGLETTLKTIAKQVSATGNLAVEILGEYPERLPAEAELGILRATQELIQNTIKHAEATNIHIRLGMAGRHFYLDYRDDGKGLPPEITPGLGLKNIRSRLQMLDGDFVLPQHSDKGIYAQFTVPFPASSISKPLAS
ncbi:MAG: sensor histidine kinase [Bacteroidota bacterium]